MTNQTPPFSIWRLLRLSSFHIGSAMGDILVTSIWNRVMIANFGIPATPVGLLIALRYLLSPLSLWAGAMSDKRPLFGLQRTYYIWGGRSLMVLSLPLLGLSLTRLGDSQTDLLGWALATASSLLYGVGTLISGSPFLALVRDSAPEEKQGLAISTAETVLIIFFAIMGITFSLWMESYNETIFWHMIIATMCIGGFFWFFAILGAEKGTIPTTSPRPSSQHRRIQDVGIAYTFHNIWADKRTRRFFIFLSLATLSAWAQDVILEPFGAEVFGLAAERTTRFNSYWQSATVVTLLGGSYLWRKRPPEQQQYIASLGLLIMAGGIFLLGITSFIEQVRLVEVALLIFGGGFGIYTFGGLSLMAVMCRSEEAGAYLGLWTISILVFKGLGNFVGSLLRDLFLTILTLPPSLTYALVFAIMAVGLTAAALLLTNIDVIGFARESGRTVSRTEAQIAIAD